jgi:hypothetical protein
VFLQTAQNPTARRRMTAALQAGVQTPELERCCYTHIWGPLADA